MNIGNADRGGFSRALHASSEQLTARVTEHQRSLERLSEGDLETVAERFEGLFLSMIVKEMRKTLPEGFFGDGPGAETFEGWFDEHVGTMLASNAPLDLIGLLKAGQSASGSVPGASQRTGGSTAEGQES